MRYHRPSPPPCLSVMKGKDILAFGDCAPQDLNLPPPRLWRRIEVSTTGWRGFHSLRPRILRFRPCASVRALALACCSGVSRVHTTRLHPLLSAPTALEPASGRPLPHRSSPQHIIPAG